MPVLRGYRAPTAGSVQAQLKALQDEREAGRILVESFTNAFKVRARHVGFACCPGTDFLVEACGPDGAIFYGMQTSRLPWSLLAGGYSSCQRGASHKAARNTPATAAVTDAVNFAAAAHNKHGWHCRLLFLAPVPLLPALPPSTLLAWQEEKRKMQLQAIGDILLALPSMVVAAKDVRSAAKESDFSGAASSAIDAAKTGQHLQDWAAAACPNLPFVVDSDPCVLVPMCLPRCPPCRRGPVRAGQGRVCTHSPASGELACQIAVLQLHHPLLPHCMVRCAYNTGTTPLHLFYRLPSCNWIK